MFCFTTHTAGECVQHFQAFQSEKWRTKSRAKVVLTTDIRTILNVSTANITCSISAWIVLSTSDVNTLKMDKLPVEILMKIFSYLQRFDNVSLVNRQFYNVACTMNDFNICLSLRLAVSNAFVCVLVPFNRKFDNHFNRKTHSIFSYYRASTIQIVKFQKWPSQYMKKETKPKCERRFRSSKSFRRPSNV